jgi:hypothetical protein
VAEDAKDLASFKIWRADKLWAKDEQNRIERATGDKPTHWELFSKMRHLYESAHGSPGAPGEKKSTIDSTFRPKSTVLLQTQDGPTIEITPGEWKWVIRFINILRSGPLAARAIKWNLMMVLKGMGIPYDAQDRPIPQPSRDDERAAREEIELAERLIADEEEDSAPHSGNRKRDRKIKG